MLGRATLTIVESSRSTNPAARTTANASQRRGSRPVSSPAPLGAAAREDEEKSEVMGPSMHRERLSLKMIILWGTMGW